MPELPPAVLAVRIARKLPDDGRTIARHLWVVWCNFGDKFPGYLDFLYEVSDCDPETDISIVAKRQLKRFLYADVATESLYVGRRPKSSYRKHSSPSDGEAA